jgi:hypothetical protein
VEVQNTTDCGVCSSTPLRVSLFEETAVKVKEEAGILFGRISLRLLSLTLTLTLTLSLTSTPKLNLNPNQDHLKHQSVVEG